MHVDCLRLGYNVFHPRKDIEYDNIIVFLLEISWSFIASTFSVTRKSSTESSIQLK